jgi:hypothetical protein
MEISPENIRFNRPFVSGVERYRVVRVMLLTVVFVFIWPPPEGFDRTPAAQLNGEAAERINYGSRAGMELTVSGKRGVGTFQALIYAKLTRDDAKKYCDQYLHDASAGCVEKYLAESQLSESIEANCVTGTFTNFYRERFRVDKIKREAATAEEYAVVNLKDGTTLDGSTTSGLSYNLEQFYALCPKWKKATQEAIQTMPSRNVVGERNDSQAGGTKGFALGAGLVEGAIICPDHETLMLMFRWYTQHVGDNFQDKVTGGRSQLIRGPAASSPDLESHGCAFVPFGTPMSLISNNIVPIVSAKLPDGRSITGVTMSVMFSRGNPPEILNRH